MNPPLPSTGNSCQSTWDYPQTFQSMKEHCPAHPSAQAPQAPLNKLLRDLEVCPWGCTWVWVYCPVSPISPSTYAHWSRHSCLPHMLLFIQSCSPLKLTASSSDQSLAQCHLFQEALSPSHTVIPPLGFPCHLSQLSYFRTSHRRSGLMEGKDSWIHLQCPLHS